MCLIRHDRYLNGVTGRQKSDDEGSKERETFLQKERR